MSAPENFIPWEQIEPLLTPGMTLGDARIVLLARLGLSPKDYTIVTKGGWYLPIRDAVREFGAHVVKKKPRGRYPKRGGEVIA